MKNSKPVTPTPIRLDADLLEEIKEASESLRMNKQETIRLSIRVGLEKLRRINFDLAKTVNDAAEAKESKETIPLAAEEPAKYSSGKLPPGEYLRSA